MEFNRILLTLISRGIRYRYLKASGHPGQPEALSMELTRRCVAKCVMCNIWKMPTDSKELDADDWLNLLESPIMCKLKELDLTGGEPFLRDDIVELLLGIERLKRGPLRQLCSVAITTNGFLTDKLLRVVDQVIGPLDDAGVALVFACGLDAVGKTHDRIRRFKGGWERLNATLDGLQKIREKHPSLVLGIKTTVTRYNIDEIEKVCRYAEERGLFTIISPYIITANRYGNIDRENSLAFSDEDKERLKEFYSRASFRWNYYRNELLRFLDSGCMAKPCSAGFNYFFIRSTGDLYSCPIIKAPLGQCEGWTVRIADPVNRSRQIP